MRRRCVYCSTSMYTLLVLTVSIQSAVAFYFNLSASHLLVLPFCVSLSFWCKKKNKIQFYRSTNRCIKANNRRMTVVIIDTFDFYFSSLKQNREKKKCTLWIQESARITFIIVWIDLFISMNAPSSQSITRFFSFVNGKNVFFTWAFFFRLKLCL